MLIPAPSEWYLSAWQYCISYYTPLQLDLSNFPNYGIITFIFLLIILMLSSIFLYNLRFICINLLILAYLLVFFIIIAFLGDLFLSIFRIICYSSLIDLLNYSTIAHLNSYDWEQPGSHLAPHISYYTFFVTSNTISINSWSDFVVLVNLSISIQYYDRMK